MKIVEKHTYKACIETTAGNIVVTLMKTAAHQAVNAFVVMANHHFYDGGEFDAVAKNDFIAGTSKTTPGFSLAVKNQGTYFMPSTVFIGRTPGGKANVGQIVICTGYKCETLDDTATPHLTGFTVIGFVSDGMNVADDIAAGPRKGVMSESPEGDAWVPKVPVRIKTIRIYTSYAPPSYPTGDSGS